MVFRIESSSGLLSHEQPYQGSCWCGPQNKEKSVDYPLSKMPFDFRRGSIETRPFDELLPNDEEIDNLNRI
jgi:hypothetical protein